MQPAYQQCVAELQDDIALYGTDDEAVEVQVMRVGWPPLEMLLRAHTVLASDFLRVYLAVEILNTWALGLQEVNEYLLNSFGAVTVVHDDVIITGACYQVS